MPQKGASRLCEKQSERSSGSWPARSSGGHTDHPAGALEGWAKTGGYALGPGEGEALWFNGGLGVLEATSDRTAGSFAALELLAPKGFASPIHIHRREDEFLVVLSGEVRVRHGGDVIEAVAGSMVFGPRDVAHGFHVDSAEARMLLFFGPAGAEGSSATPGSRPDPSRCRPSTSSSSIGRPSSRS